MAEQSYPGEELPLTGDQWRSVTRGIGDGVLDEGGNPYGITLDNVKNTATISVDTGTPGKYAHAILRGFYHRLTSAQALSVPAVTATTTYTIALQLDPTRKAMPVQLGVYKGALDKTGGKAYLILHTIERKANQLLTDATLTTYRPRTSPSILVYKSDELPPASEVLFGTIAVVHGEHDIKVAMASSWKSIVQSEVTATMAGLKPVWKTLLLNSNLEGSAQYAILSTGEVLFRGRVAPKRGNSFVRSATVYFGRVDEGVTWDGGAICVCAADGDGTLRISTASGGTGARELEYYTKSAVSWVDLSAMRAWIK